MSSEITVKYNNDMHEISMRGWTAVEMNLMFTIFGLIKNKGIKKITLNTENLMELSNFKYRDQKEWENTIVRTADKIVSLNYIKKEDTKIKIMNVFSMFEVDIKSKEIVASVSENFEYILNDLNANFTTYELQEFVNIKSSYAKTMYRLLKQWRTIGKKRYEILEFRELLGIPETYGVTNINKNVISYIEKELPLYFHHLKVKPIKENRRGTPVVAYEFTWKPEQTSGTWIQDKYAKYKDKDGKRLPKGWKIENGIYYKDGQMIPKVIAEDFIEKDRMKLNKE